MSREVIFLLTIVHENYLYIFAIYFTIVRIYNSETFFGWCCTQMMGMRLDREVNSEEPLTWVKRNSNVRQADTLVQFQSIPRKTQPRNEVTLNVIRLWLYSGVGHTPLLLYRKPRTLSLV
jgi:hypothetical protein